MVIPNDLGLYKIWCGAVYKKKVAMRAVFRLVMDALYDKYRASQREFLIGKHACPVNLSKFLACGN